MSDYSVQQEMQRIFPELEQIQEDLEFYKSVLHAKSDELWRQKLPVEQKVIEIEQRLLNDNTLGEISDDVTGSEFLTLEESQKQLSGYDIELEDVQSSYAKIGEFIADITKAYTELDPLALQKLLTSASQFLDVERQKNPKLFRDLDEFDNKAINEFQSSKNDMASVELPLSDPGVLPDIPGSALTGEFNMVATQPEEILVNEVAAAPSSIKAEGFVYG